MFPSAQFSPVFLSNFTPVLTLIAVTKAVHRIPIIHNRGSKRQRRRVAGGDVATQQRCRRYQARPVDGVAPQHSLKLVHEVLLLKGRHTIAVSMWSSNAHTETVRSKEQCSLCEWGHSCRRPQGRYLEGKNRSSPVREPHFKRCHLAALIRLYPSKRLAPTPSGRIE